MSHTVLKTMLGFLNLSGLIMSLTFSQRAEAQRGGGSSTGGGHVRVCLVPMAAAKVKSNILMNSQSPQMAVDVLTGIQRGDIVSVDLLDLIEQPAYSPKIEAALNSFVKLPAGTPALEVLQTGLYEMVDQLERTGLSAFNPDKSNFAQYAVDISANTTWTASDSGLALTRDFDPKILNKENCVFAQAVRQEVISPHFRTLIYDQRILQMMSRSQLIALGLHEAIYNLVLNSPARDHIANASVLTRQLTVLILMAFTEDYTDMEAIAESLESIGYGPFDDMVRPSHRMTRKQLQKYLACEKPYVCKSVKVRK
jgi:hypothetical protein